MITVSQKAVCKDGYRGLTSWSAAKAYQSEFPYSYAFVVPMSDDVMPGKEYVIDGTEVGDLIPPKDLVRRMKRRNAYLSSRWCVTTPFGSTLNTVYHDSIAGSIAVGAFENAKSIDLGEGGKNWWRCLEPRYENIVFTDSSADYEAMSLHFNHTISDRWNTAWKTKDYYYAEYEDNFVYLIHLVQKYVFKYWSRWESSVTVTCHGSKNGSIYFETTNADEYDKRPFDPGIIPPFPVFDISTLKANAKKKFISKYGNPTGKIPPDPLFAAQFVELPDKIEMVKTLNSHCRALTSMAQRECSTRLSLGWGQSCNDALNSARFVETNMLEFWKDIGETFAEVGAFKQLIQKATEVSFKSVKSFMRYLKSMTTESANTYLATYYGTRLTMSDLEVISNGIADFIWTYYSESRKDPRILRGTYYEELPCSGSDEDVWRLRTNYLLNYNPYVGSSEFKEIVRELGYAPTLDQIWACIPLSFVVDWFYDVSSQFNVIENDRFYHSLAINYEVKSYRVTRDISTKMKALHGWNCSLGYTLYTRLVSLEPTVYPGVINPVGNPAKHWLQGGALIVSALG